MKFPLKISDQLRLPIDTVTQTMAVLARRGAGKTYFLNVLMEEFVAHQLPFVMLDPTGVCWGLRSSVDGEKTGLPVTIFGGSHGDLPLDRHSGKAVADAVVNHPGWYVLDLSEFESNAAQDQFVTAFALRLFRAKATNKDPLHLLLDEADSFAPQRPQPGQQPMLGAIEAIVRRGRSRGIGITMATQRAAVLNKNVLTQCEVMIAMQITGPQDRAAVDKWIEGNGSADERKKVLDSLASLETGHAWFWSPSWMRTLQRFHVRKKYTFDSSQTPKAGAITVAPTQLAPVDLDNVRVSIAETMERVKRDDPKELRRTIAELERDLVGERKRSGGLEAALNKARSTRQPVASAQVDKKAGAATDRAIKDIQRHAEAIIHAGDEMRLRERVRGLPGDQRAEPVVKESQRQPLRVSVPTSIPRGGKRTPKEKILDAMAWFDVIGIQEVHKTQLAFFSGPVSPKSSGYTNNLSALRTSGCITYPRGGYVALADAGREQAITPERPPTNDDLQTMILSALAVPRQNIITALISAYPEPMAKQRLADIVSKSASSSGYTNNLSGLRSLGLLDYPTPGMVVGTKLLFLEER